ncbi:MAG: hypothetical protein ACKO3I_10135 [Synechococcales cyanobacterium]
MQRKRHTPDLKAKVALEALKGMTAFLRTQEENVNPKRVCRLLRTMGLEAIYPKPKLSQPSDNSRRSLSAQGTRH